MDRSGHAVNRSSDADLGRLADLLNTSGAVTLLCGSGTQGAHDEVVAFADTPGAPVVHALRAKQFVEWDNLFDVGMTGLIGFSSGYHAMESCDVLLMLGTDFPYRLFYPGNAKVAQIDWKGSQLGHRAPLELGLVGTVKDTIKALLPRLQRRMPDINATMPSIWIRAFWSAAFECIFLNSPEVSPLPT